MLMLSRIAWIKIEESISRRNQFHERFAAVFRDCTFFHSLVLGFRSRYSIGKESGGFEAAHGLE